MKPWLWITDPWSTLDHPNDTTLRIMEACLQIGKPVAWADVRSLRWEHGRVMADCALFEGGKRGSRKLYSLRKVHSAPPATHEAQVIDFEAIHYRVDPPVDLAYLQPLQMLEQVASKKICNPARALALLSEKTIPASLKGLWPQSVVSSQLGTLLDFIQTQGVAILKPLHGAQSKGVIKLSSDDDITSLHSHLSDATQNFTRPTVLQEYLPEVTASGETRLWFVDGVLIACAQKIPARGEFKIDMDQGAKVKKTRLPPSLLPRVRQISRWLKEHKIRLAAVDWISGKITDFNITSPGLIVSMEKALKRNLARQIARKLLG
ncbi:MAG: hypothetical protein ACK5QT_02735 [Oligoflexia bacterium]